MAARQIWKMGCNYSLMIYRFKIGRSMTKVVFAVIYEAYQFNVFIQLFQKLSSKKNYNFIIYSPYYLPHTERYLQICGDEGFHYIYSTTSQGGDANVFEQINKIQFHYDNNKCSKPRHYSTRRAVFLIRNNIKYFFRLPIIIFKKMLLNFISIGKFKVFKNRSGKILEYINIYQNTDRQITAILTALNPSILLFTEDSVERDSNIWIKKSHRRGILSLIVSSSTATITEAAETYFNHPDYLFPSNSPKYIQWILSLTYRKWCFNYRGKKFIRLPLNQLIAMDLLDFSPRLPWTINSGDVDMVLVESEFSRDLQIKDGIKSGKLQVMGSLKFDLINNYTQNLEQARQEIYSKYNLNPDRKLILCAVPPYLPERLLHDFENYDDMITKWVSALESSNLNVLYSIHPSGFPVTADKIRALGQNVIDEALEILLPHCDVYLASVSSTIKWARACNKLVLDFDCFRFNYKTYDVDQAIIPVKTFNELGQWIDCLGSQSLQSITNNLNILPHHYWGRIDGLSFHRFYHYIESIIK